MNSRAFRDALGCFTTGITVITTVGPRGELIGLTANSFNSVSLDPPLILFSLDRQAYSFEAFGSARRFAVNVLARDQRPLSHAFAQPGGAKWEGVGYRLGDSGCPLLSGALAAFECEVRDVYPGGDHVIIVGGVLAFESTPTGEPLVYFRGVYRALDRSD